LLPKFSSNRNDLPNIGSTREKSFSPLYYETII
jgi:hypothetical protein